MLFNVKLKQKEMFGAFHLVACGNNVKMGWLVKKNIGVMRIKLKFKLHFCLSHIRYIFMSHVGCLTMRATTPMIPHYFKLSSNYVLVTEMTYCAFNWFTGTAWNVRWLWWVLGFIMLALKTRKRAQVCTLIPATVGIFFLKQCTVDNSQRCCWRWENMS